MPSLVAAPVWCGSRQVGGRNEPPTLRRARYVELCFTDPAGRVLLFLEENNRGGNLAERFNRQDNHALND